MRETIDVKCSCGASLSVPVKLASANTLVEVFLIEHRSCRPARPTPPPPPPPPVDIEPATEP